MQCFRIVSVFSFFFTLASFLISPAASATAASTLSEPFFDKPPITETKKPAIGISGNQENSLTAARAEEPGPETPAPVAEAVPPVRLYINDFFPDTAGGTENIFSSRNLAVAIIGGSLTAAAVTIDHADFNVKHYFQTRRPLDGVSKYGSQIGQGYVHVAVGLSLFGIGQWSGNKQLADTGIVTLQALLVNGVVTELLKYAIERRRPNGSNRLSFPSGHSSSTAALAASISAMYDWNLPLTIPLYSAALFVGASRMQDNAHYLSDVIGGLTLGTLVGSSFAHYQKGKEALQASQQRIAVAPIIDREIKGCLFTLTW